MQVRRSTNIPSKIQQRLLRRPIQRRTAIDPGSEFRTENDVNNDKPNPNQNPNQKLNKEGEQPGQQREGQNSPQTPGKAKEQAGGKPDA